MSVTAVSSIRALASDLPAVWAAATTTPADRQRIARLLLERVVVTVDKASEQVEVILHWVGPIPHLDPISPAVRPTLGLPTPGRALCDQRRSASAIAESLNSEGYRPPKRTDRFTRDMVLRLIGQLGLGCRPPHGSRAGLGRNEYRPAGLAKRLGVNRDTVRRWVKVKWVSVSRDADGHHVIWADASELHRLRALHRLPRTWANKARLADLKKPKSRPA